jgi:uncharacterized membrane protein
VSSRLRTTAIVLAAAAVIHVGFVWLLPRAIVSYVQHRLGWNQIHHEHLPTAAWKSVPMPSPDQLYSACAYDASQGPVLVTAEVPHSYWSVSAFASNTDNFFVLDDRDVREHQARVVFTTDASYRDPGGGRVVQVPSPTGIILFRLLVLDRQDTAALERVQHAAKCERLG